MTEATMNPAGPHGGPDALGRMVRVHPLTIQALLKRRGEVGQGYVLNLSGGGAFVRTDADFEIGETVRLRFFLPFQIGEVDAEALVRWRSQDPGTAFPQPGLGVEFVTIDNPSRRNIQSFIDKFVQLADRLDD